MITYDPGFLAELGQELLSYYFEHFHFKQNFWIEIVWQITTVIVKSCEQLHLIDPFIYSFLQKLFCYDISVFFQRNW